MPLMADLWPGHQYHTQWLKRIVRSEQERQGLGRRSTEARERCLGWCEGEWKRQGWSVSTAGTSWRTANVASVRVQALNTSANSHLTARNKASFTWTSLMNSLSSNPKNHITTPPTHTYRIWRYTNNCYLRNKFGVAYYRAKAHTTKTDCSCKLQD